MGFEKDEQPNSGTNPLTNESLIEPTAWQG